MEWSGVDLTCWSKQFVVQVASLINIILWGFEHTVLCRLIDWLTWLNEEYLKFDQSYKWKTRKLLKVHLPCMHVPPRHGLNNDQRCALAFPAATAEWPACLSWSNWFCSKASSVGNGMQMQCNAMQCSQGCTKQKRCHQKYDCIWHLAFGIWHLSIWHLSIWHLVFGVWHLSIWRLAFGILAVVLTKIFFCFCKCDTRVRRVSEGIVAYTRSTKNPNTQWIQYTKERWMSPGTSTKAS